MTIDTAKSLAAYKVLDLIPASPGLLSSQFVRLTSTPKELVLNLTGLVFAEVRVPATDGASWVFYADRRVLGGFLSILNTTTVDVIHSEKSLLLRSGRQKIELSAAGEIVGYQQWKPATQKAKAVLSEEMQNGLEVLSHYAPDLAALDHLSAVCILKGYGAVATNSMSLAARFDKTTQQSLMLPASLAKLLRGLGHPELHVEEKGVGVKVEFGYIYQINSSKLQKEYPVDTVKGLANDGMKLTPLFTLKGSDFSSAVAYLEGFAGFGAGSDAAISLSVQKKTLVFGLKLPAGVVERRLPLPAEIATITDSWQVNALAPWAKSVPDESAVSYAKDEQGFQFFRTKNSVLVLAPHE